MSPRTLALGALLLVGCDTAPEDASADTAAPAASIEDGRSVRSAFDAAAEAFDVPADLLAAIALVETNNQMIVGEEEHPGRPRAFGAMALREDVLPRAAALADLPESAVMFDRDANVMAAAAWLSALADELAIDRDDLGAWAPVAAEYSDIELEAGRSQYVHEGVFRVLREGARIEDALVGKIDVMPDYPRVEDPRRSVDYPGAVWRPSPNYNSRGGADVDFIVIHSCEGSYSGCWSWLTNTAAGASAHYVVKEDGNEISQLVNESDRAWHIAANYDCANNSSVECWRNGSSMNTISVGIEHAGYASQSSWNSNLIQRSAELVCDIATDQGVTIDSYHVVAHGQLQPWNRTDPGPNWPWADYLDRARAACGQGGGGGGGGSVGTQKVIDSNNGANVTSEYYLEVSANWTSSTNVSGYWNTGYYAAPTAAVSDGATFWFNEPVEACYQVDAWWTAAFDRAPSAPFIAYNASSTEVGRTYVNQSTNGSRWNTLGTWVFTPGWNRILLSRWTATGAYVIADAVRLTPSDQCPGWNACTDSDGDGTCDADDDCPNDPAKTSPGTCGCGTPDTDGDGDGTPDCIDQCPTDPAKTSPGTCGCGVSDVDSDGDGAPDCIDQCPADPAKTDPGDCGCGVVDEDITGDGVADCTTCGDGTLEGPAEQCDDGGRAAGDGCDAMCQLEPLLFDVSPGQAGVDNTWWAGQASPGGGVFWLAARQLGSTAIPGCPGVFAPLNRPVLLGSAATAPDGTAASTLRPPARLAGSTFALVAIDGASCRVSDVIVQTF